VTRRVDFGNVVQPHSNPPPIVSSAPPLRLLLIEDSFAVAREFETALRTLEGERLHVHHVETLGEALRVLGARAVPFDCLVVDLRLSDVEGLPAVKRLRGVDPSAPIVVIAGEEDRGTAVEALRHGAQDLLIYPWQRTAELAVDLRRVVRGAIERRQQQAAHKPLPPNDDEETADLAAPPRADEDTAFVMRFQPWIQMEERRIYGIEAMLGSRATQDSPREILRAAETRGELGALSEWLLRRVGPLWRQWRSAGIAPPRLAVNVAPSELQARRFARSRLALLQEHGLSPGEMQFELAEDAIVEAGVKPLAELQELRAAGVRIVADNVGRSQVALLALARLPLDGIKLDYSLIESVRLQDRASRAAVRGLVAMCTELGITCCAVGVENETDFNASRELGIHFLQGYWVGRPQSQDAIARWLEACVPKAQRRPSPITAPPPAPPA
jgi:EAL domain-containing protein (putative c-di-GMP-specific phosphodiesterase class I)